MYQVQDPKHAPLETMFRDDITLILQTPLLAGQLNQHNITGVLEVEIIILEIHLILELEVITIQALAHHHPGLTVHPVIQGPVILDLQLHQVLILLHQQEVHLQLDQVAEDRDNFK